MPARRVAVVRAQRRVRRPLPGSVLLRRDTSRSRRARSRSRAVVVVGGADVASHARGHRREPRRGGARASRDPPPTAWREHGGSPHDRRRDPPLRHRRHRRHRAPARARGRWPTRSATLVAVTDHVRDEGRRVRRADGATRPCTTTSMQLLAAEQPDVVLICTPPGAHREQTLAAFAAGAHVVVEKPPAPSLDELDEMRERRARPTGAARGRLPAAHRHRRRARRAPPRSRVRSAGRCSRSARPCGSATPTTSRCRGAASGRPRAAARRWATASISSTCWRSCSATGRACEGRLWRLDRETQTEDASTATVMFANGVGGAGRLEHGLAARRRARSASTRRRRRSPSTTCTATDTRTGAITPAPHVDEDEAATWALPESRSAAITGRCCATCSTRCSPASRCRRPPTRRRARSRLVAAIYASAAADGAVDHAGRPRRAPDPSAADSAARSPTAGPITRDDRPGRPDSPHRARALPRPDLRRRDRPARWCATATARWMFYTQRRATHAARGTGCRVGARRAASASRAAPTASCWDVRGHVRAVAGRALTCSPGPSRPRSPAPHWAPEVIHDGERWRMYLTEIDGVPDSMGGSPAAQSSSTSRPTSTTGSGRGPISARERSRHRRVAVVRCPDGLWRLWFKDEAADSTTACRGLPTTS